MTEAEIEDPPQKKQCKETSSAEINSSAPSVEKVLCDTDNTNNILRSPVTQNINKIEAIHGFDTPRRAKKTLFHSCHKNHEIKETGEIPSSAE